MKAECVQEKLQKTLSQTEKIVGKNLNLPVLSCVFLEAKKNGLKIKATNLDLGFEGFVPAKIEEEGVLAVPGAVFSSFVSNLQGEKSVKIRNDGLVLSILTPKSRTAIKCLPTEDFPSIPEIAGGKTFRMLPRDFVKGLRAVGYSSSVSNIKAELSSVFVHFEENYIVFAATDSFRLAEQKIKIKTAETERFLLPFKNIAEIARVLESLDADVEIRLSKNQIAFVSEGTYLTSRLIDGTFPDYRQIIPKEYTTEAVLLKEDLVRSLKMTTIFSDSFNQLTVHVSPGAKRFELTSKNHDLGENTSVLDAAMSGEDTEAKFNYRYIADCLQSICADSVSFSFAGAGRPAVIRGAGDKNFTYLVMPMNK